MQRDETTSGGIVVEEDFIDDTRFRVIFVRDFKRGVRIAEIREKLRQRFNLSQEGVDRMFAGRAVVVKENVDARVAYAYKRAIDATGARCRIEVMPRLSALEKEVRKRLSAGSLAGPQGSGRKR